MDRKIETSRRYQALFNKIKTIEPLSIGNFFFHLELEPPTADLENRAKNELRETPEIVEQALVEIKKLIKEEVDLKVPDDIFFLTKFLRPCKWHAKSGFELIKRYFRFRQQRPLYSVDLVPKYENSIFTTRVLTPLPFRAKDGSRIILLQGGRVWNPKKTSVIQTFRGLMILIDTVFNEPATQINGLRVIIDMDGLSLSQVTYFTPGYAATVLEWIQKCLPGRLKSLDIINQPFIFNMVFAIFKPFIDEKFRKRIIFHGNNRENLKSCYGIQALPTQYGGEMEFPQTEPLEKSVFDYMCNYNEEFEELENIGYPKISK